MHQPKSEYLSEAWKDGLFTGKVVFCTGGNGTICSQQVRAMIHLGCDACIVGRSVEKTEAVARDLATAREGSKVIGIGAVDVRDVGVLQKAVTRCVDELGGIDFLIAGAAGNFLVPLSQLSPNGFKTVIDIDVLGSFNITKLCLPHLAASAKRYNSTSSLPHPKGPQGTAGPGGRIIFVGSTNHYTGLPLQTHVSAAKAGIEALSASVAIEYGPLGMTSNVVAPGPIMGTEGMNRLSKRAVAAPSPSQGEAALIPFMQYAKKIPLGRWGLNKEVADATVYLFSDAGNYVNGTTLVVDGASWRMSYGPGTADFEYPEFILSGDEVSGVQGGKKNKL